MSQINFRKIDESTGDLQESCSIRVKLECGETAVPYIVQVENSKRIALSAESDKTVATSVVKRENQQTAVPSVVKMEEHEVFEQSGQRAYPLLLTKLDTEHVVDVSVHSCLSEIPVVCPSNVSINVEPGVLSNTDIQNIVIDQDDIVSQSTSTLDQRDPCLLTKGSHICSICLMTFDFASKLKTHSLAHINDYPYKCDICNKGFKTTGNLNRHTLVHSSHKPYNCDICLKGFKQKYAYKSHLVTHTDNKAYKCTICNKQFFFKGSLKRHGQVHSGEMHQCSVCSKLFMTKFSLKAHLRTHSSELPYQCTFCSKVFKQKSNMTTHVHRIHTEKRTYKCSICPETFSSKSSLSNHKTTHAENLRFRCIVCSKDFPKRSSLRVHTRIHTGYRPYKCAVCFISFAYRLQFTQHMLLHIDKCPNKCEVCFKIFAYKTSLDKHMVLAHAKNTPNTCGICQRSFTSRRCLQSHQRIHVGGEAHKCHQCKRTFISLDQHVCTANRVYTCRKCGKTFIRWVELLRHRRVHRAGSTNFVTPAGHTYTNCDRDNYMYARNLFDTSNSGTKDVPPSTGQVEEAQGCSNDVSNMMYSDTLPLFAPADGIRTRQLGRPNVNMIKVEPGQQPVGAVLVSRGVSANMTPVAGQPPVLTGIQQKHACDGCHKTFSSKSHLLAHTALLHPSR